MAEHVPAVSTMAGFGDYTLSFFETDQPWRYPKHVHQGHCELVILVGGRLMQTINGVETVLTAGHVILIRENDSHDLRSNDVKYYNMRFTNHIFEHIEGVSGMKGLRSGLLKGDQPPVVLLSADELDYFQIRLNKAMVTTGTEARFLEISRIFTTLMLDHFIAVTSSQKPTDGRPAWLTEITEHLERNPDRPVSVAGMVEDACVSAEHMSRTFRKFLGVTPSRFIARHRLQQACRLLSDTNRKILDICYRVGFDNLGYFYKLFREEYGITPAQYRQRYHPKMPHP